MNERLVIIQIPVPSCKDSDSLGLGGARSLHFQAVSSDSGAGIGSIYFENCCISGAGSGMQRVGRVLWWPAPADGRAG